MATMLGRRTLALAVVGTGRAVLGLFGVGGGIVIVPLLVLWLGYGEREATGTSLAAIVVIAAVAAAPRALRQRARGEGLLVGIPAVGGVVAGTWLQQRVRPWIVRLLFAVLLAGSPSSSRCRDPRRPRRRAGGHGRGMLGIGGGALFVPPSS
jgi:uncharacterized membrane protein YfcA